MNINRPSNWCTLATYAVLGSAALVAVVLPDALPQIHAVPQAADPDTVELTGIVRDFKRAHDDFDVVPAAGYGHYAGNLAEQLDSRGRPQFKGGAPVDDFALTNQIVTPGDDFAVEVRVLGSAIYSGSYHRPVTMRLRIGGTTVDPFGPFEQPVQGNVNDDQSATGNANPGSNPRRLVLGDMYPAGASVTVIGRSWEKISGSGTSNSDWTINREGDTATNSIQVRVLQDGDPVPTDNGEYDQASVADYVSDYIDFTDDTMDLGPNQIIYLYELGKAGDDPAADIQDLVVLMSLATSPGYFAANGSNGSSGGPPGFKVADQWRDAAGNPIAPHLAAQSGVQNAITLSSAPMIGSGVVLDSWDPSSGPYDPATAGTAPTFETGATMPTINEPSLGPSVGNVAWTGPYTHSVNLHCDGLSIDGQITISGAVTILCEGLFEVVNHAEILLAPGATLTMYLKGGAELGTKTATGVPAYFNDTGDPSRFRIFNLGTDPLVTRPHALLFASVVSPNAPLSLSTKGEFFGSFVGQGLSLGTQAEFHNAGTPGRDACGALLADSDGTAGAASTGGITSAETFGQWFADHPGVNLSKRHSITLVDNGAGIYEYATATFHPIDGMLLRNEGEAHNYNFTYAIQASFVYDACAGQFFEFEGADDAWLFVRGDLAMDRGGVIPGTAQYAAMDRLGLTDGETYQMHFFYGQRQAVQAGFSVRTNILFQMPGLPATVTAEFD